MGNNILKINQQDSVAVALNFLEAEASVKINQKSLTLRDDIPDGHKIALKDIDKGEEVIKYGNSIGVASSFIQKGEWVHTHNLKTGLKEKSNYAYNPEFDQSQKQQVNHQSGSKPFFRGYRRKNGKVGIRNEIWIINTVGCINKPCQKLAQKSSQDFKNILNQTSISGIYNFPHPFGCSQLGEDLKNTQKILAGLVKHPNAGAVLVAGLGCENNQIDSFKKIIGEYNQDRVKFINFQSVDNGIETGLNKIKELIKYAEGFNSKKIPVSQLKLGLKCGGSDSFSGITANPLVGKISDKVVNYGGTTILSEVPEMFGAEKILINRASSQEVFQEIVDLIDGFKKYYIDNGQEIYENPSPGNIEGGITTLEEKSLGNIEKGGSGIIEGVNFYGDRIEESGLQLLESPGNDLVSTTALIAAGAQMVLFTTGRGTPFGGAVPTVKIATTNDLYHKKRNWIDFNAGQIIEGVGLDELAGRFFDYLLEVASNEEQTQNEVNDYREIAIFKTGVTL